MAKSNKRYAVVCSDGLTYIAPTLPEAKRVYSFLCIAFPDSIVNLNIQLM